MKRSPKKPGAAAARRAPMALANPMAEQVGPEFHDDLGMRAALAPEGDELLAAGSLDALCAAKGVLVVSAFDGSRMFPTWQVRAGAVLPGLAAALVAMDGQPAWSVGLWVTSAHDDLDGRSPRQVLEAGEDPAVVVAMAAETARRWS